MPSPREPEGSQGLGESNLPHGLRRVKFRLSVVDVRVPALLGLGTSRCANLACSPMRVLLADDSQHLVLLYRAVLEDAGFDVVTATTGIAAIAAARDAHIDAAVL